MMDAVLFGRLIVFSLGEAVYKVPVDIGGSHSALCLVTQISERDRVHYNLAEHSSENFLGLLPLNYI